MENRESTIILTFTGDTPATITAAYDAIIAAIDAEQNPPTLEIKVHATGLYNREDQNTENITGVHRGKATMYPSGEGVGNYQPPFETRN